MFCNKCGNQIVPTAKFCPYCGNQLNSSNNKKFNFKSFIQNNKKLLTVLLLSIILVILIINYFTSSKTTLSNNKIHDGTRTIMMYIVGSNLESDSGIVTADLKAIDPSAIDLTKTNVIIY